MLPSLFKFTLTIETVAKLSSIVLTYTYTTTFDMYLTLAIVIRLGLSGLDPQRSILL